MMMVQLPVLTGFSSLNLVWGSQIEVFGPRPQMIFNLMWYSTTCCQLHPQTLPGCITGALLGAHYPLICGSSCLIARGMSSLTQDGVYFYGDRVYQLGCSRVPRVRSGECRASMDATHLIFDKKTILPSGSQTWQLKILYDYSNCNFKALFKW